MREVRVTIEIENSHDREFAERGLWSADRVRRTAIEAVVDTGAVMLVLPEDVVNRLGLRRTRTVMATYADGRSEERWIVDGVNLRVASRLCQVECVVGSPGMPTLLGQIPLEAMDLLVDCASRRLVPNPRSPDMPMLTIY